MSLVDNLIQFIMNVVKIYQQKRLWSLQTLKVYATNWKIDGEKCGEDLNCKQYLIGL